MDVVSYILYIYGYSKLYTLYLWMLFTCILNIYGCCKLLITSSMHKYFIEGLIAVNILFQLMDSDFIYGFEYLGSASRLIITPSSQKMFVSMMQNIESCKASLCVGSNVSISSMSIIMLTHVNYKVLLYLSCHDRYCHYKS